MDRIISLLIVVMNVLILYDLQQLKASITGGTSGTLLNICLSIGLIVYTIAKKPIEVIDFRPSKNIDLK